MNWTARLAPGSPPLRPGEFATMTGWAYNTIRKLIIAKAIPTVCLVEGGEGRIPVTYARTVALEMGIIEAAA